VTKVYFIIEGEAEVERSGDRVAKLHPGDVFGEAALISNQPRNGTIRASSRLDTVAVSRNAFQQLLMHLPGLNNTMQELMSDRMKPGEDLKELVRKANSLAHDSRTNRQGSRGGFEKRVSAKCSRLSVGAELRIRLCG
jgi:CRP-like cAMP-binding protein